MDVCEAHREDFYAIAEEELGEERRQSGEGWADAEVIAHFTE
jgi:hypothetical protein